MNEKLIFEKIKYYTEIVKVFFTIAIVVAGGIVTILFNFDSFLKLIVLLIGLFFEIIVIIIVKDLNLQISGLFQKMEKNK